MHFFGKKKEIKEEPKIVPQEIHDEMKFVYPDMGSTEVKKLLENFDKPSEQQKTSEPQHMANIETEEVTETPQTIVPPKKEIREERQSSTPLFVKLEKYRSIINSVTNLKSSLTMIKNTLAVLNELEKVRHENMKLLQDALAKTEKKILDLDSEFIRPPDFQEELPEYGDVETVSTTIEDLKGQIGRLKEELNTMT